MSEHYLVSVAYHDRSIFGGCRCGWVFKCSSREWPYFFVKHRREEQ